MTFLLTTNRADLLEPARALVSAERADGDGHGALAVGDAELRAALDQLLAERNQLTRILLGANRDHDPPDP